MDDVVIGKGSIVAALTFVSSNTIIPERSLVVGNPGKVIKQVSDEMLAWKTEGTKYYQKLPKDCQNNLIACEPLTEIEANRPIQEKDYFKFSK
jgi:carbonic anhydrase/acetyltransferase-like protein (isoleucine patch superfamily)